MQETNKSRFDLAPANEPERQLYFIRECKSIVSEIKSEKGRELYADIKTFGCQMNVEPVTT